MTRYLDVGAELARQVRTGELAAGAELPTVRDCARSFSTAATTVTRAYRYLAEAGVITLSARRRARVATGGALAAARLLEADRVFRLAGSDDPALQLLLDHVGAVVTNIGVRGSFWALRTLSRGDADGAAVHLRHRCGDYNASFARALLRDRDPHMIRLWRREQGLLVAPGNPHRVTGVLDVPGRRVAQRQTGAGTRVLLDQLLLDEGIVPESVAGPTLHSHLETGLAVAAGIADVALGLRTTARELGLGFVPVTIESYDIVLPGEALPSARPLIYAFADTTLCRRITDLGGYDLADAGHVEPV